jgi:glycosyltransferase involved in cell wall biosynthesis
MPIDAVTIIICTYNRCVSLRQTLTDLAGIAPPPDQSVEVLVVDNNSTDETAAMMEGQDRCGPFPLRYLRETQQGLSHARNRGIVEARGDWIVFTDDDVRIEPDWLAALMRALKATGAPMAGGRVFPIWPVTDLPRWVATEGPFIQQGVFLHYDRGECCRLLDKGDPEPFGCNMAFHADLFRKYGLFRTDLGRTGGKLLAGEDTEMFSRLRGAGISLCYAPDAIVRHPVESRRLSVSYLTRWKFWAGYGEARMAISETRRTLGGAPVCMFGQLIAAGVKSLYYWLRRNAPASAYHLGRMSARTGFIYGSWSLRSERRRRPVLACEQADSPMCP